VSLPTISIVLPLYNGERHVAEAIQSVLSQTFGDFELLVCDDGSTDATVSIAAAFDDPRIRRLANARNLGLFPTLNRLVAEARGRYVRFWSQDDRMKPDCLAVEMAFWRAHPNLGLTYCLRDTIDDDGRPIKGAALDRTPDVIEPWLATQIAFYHGCLQGNIATVTVPRDVLARIGPFGDFRVSGDFEMWTRIAQQLPIGFISRSLIELRNHAGQFSQRAGERLHFVREDRVVYERLRRDLPEELHATAERFDRRRRVWNVHYVARCLLAGRLAMAAAVWRELRRQGTSWRDVGRWAVTLNQTLTRTRPVYRHPDGRTAPEPFHLVPHASAPLRVTAVLTHPIQYLSPWFRHIARREPAVDLTVLYAAEPDARQQGVGFGVPFKWDVPLVDGYQAHVVGGTGIARSVSSDSFFGVDVRAIGAAIRDTHPDVVLIPGWHSITFIRALNACRRAGIPTLYRGDTHLGCAPVGWRRTLWRVRTQLLLRLFDGYLAVGRRQREYLESFGIDPGRIVDSPHVVDASFFAKTAAPYQTSDGRLAARASLGLSADAFVVLFAGKLEAIKRPLDVLRAAARLKPGATVLMVGCGELEADCHGEARRLGVKAVWPGFLNQSELAKAYASADCLVLPSASESWGLVVNEALATGLPCVVSNTVGCAPDLIDDRTGAVFPNGDVMELARQIERLRGRLAEGHSFAADCQARATASSYEAATDGLLHAAQSSARSAGGSPLSVVACCGHMVTPGGLERMSFEVLSVLREADVPVHCIFNRWGNNRMVPLAKRIGATWSTGYYLHPLTRRPSPRAALRMLIDIAATSGGLVANARQRRASHIFIPDFGVAIRNSLALVWLRLTGAAVVMRIGNAPPTSRFYPWLWRWLLRRLADRFVCNSAFVARELEAFGVPAEKVTIIPNRLSYREETMRPDVMRDPHRIIYVGQVIPEKGVDLLLEAVALLAATRPDVTLDVVGQVDGWVSDSYRGYRERLMVRAVRPDLKGRVRFLGWRDDVDELYRVAAVHCCPSRPEQREGFPNVVLEAKRAATPSVVFATGPLPELVRHREDGWVSEAITAEALAAGLAYFLDEPDVRERAGRAAAASLQRFSADAFARRWWSVFTDSDRPPESARESVAA